MAEASVHPLPIARLASLGMSAAELAKLEDDYSHSSSTKQALFIEGFDKIANADIGEWLETQREQTRYGLPFKWSGKKTPGLPTTRFQEAGMTVAEIQKLQELYDYLGETPEQQAIFHRFFDQMEIGQAS